MFRDFQREKKQTDGEELEPWHLLGQGDFPSTLDSPANILLPLFSASASLLQNRKEISTQLKHGLEAPSICNA
jgi:hypothetical protein